MIMCYKIITNKVNINMDNFSMFNQRSTRGNEFKLRKVQRFTKQLRCQNVSIRSTEDWNSLLILSNYDFLVQGYLTCRFPLQGFHVVLIFMSQATSTCRHKKKSFVGTLQAPVPNPVGRRIRKLKSPDEPKVVYG